MPDEIEIIPLPPLPEPPSLEVYDWGFIRRYRVTPEELAKLFPKPKS